MARDGGLVRGGMGGKLCNLKGTQGSGEAVLNMI